METIHTSKSEGFVSIADGLIQQGIQQGLQQGMQKGIVLVAFKMLKKGLDAQLIKESTGLTDEQIEYIRNLKSIDDLEL